MIICELHWKKPYHYTTLHSKNFLKKSHYKLKLREPVSISPSIGSCPFLFGQNLKSYFHLWVYTNYPRFFLRLIYDSESDKTYLTRTLPSSNKEVTILQLVIL